MRHGLMVVGRVIDVEHRKGTFVPKDGANSGESISYDFRVAHILAGRKMHEVRIENDGPVSAPVIDSEVCIIVQQRSGRLVALETVEAVVPGVRKAV